MFQNIKSQNYKVDRRKQTSCKSIPRVSSHLNSLKKLITSVAFREGKCVVEGWSGWEIFHKYPFVSLKFQTIQLYHLPKYNKIILLVPTNSRKRPDTYTACLDFAKTIFIRYLLKPISQVILKKVTLCFLSLIFHNLYGMQNLSICTETSTARSCPILCVNFHVAVKTFGVAKTVLELRVKERGNRWM